MPQPSENTINYIFKYSVVTHIKKKKILRLLVFVPPVSINVTDENIGVCGRHITTTIFERMVTDGMKGKFGEKPNNILVTVVVIALITNIDYEGENYFSNISIGV